MTGAEALALSMGKAGVKRIYGVVETSNVSFINALYSLRDTIRYVSCRHEQVSASMADAEGRLTGRPGISVSHSGPGTLNTAISLAIALKDCSPMVAVSGAVPRKLRGLGGFLEVEHGKVFRPICKGVFRAEKAAEIPGLFSSAWKKALDHPRGPVLLEVPEDVWTEETAPDLNGLTWEVKRPPPVRREKVQKALKLLEGSERPVILAGGGVIQSDASSDLARLVGGSGIPLVTTGNGRGSIPEDHPLCYGRSGFGGGNPVADHALSRADCILVLGATLSETTTYGETWDVPGRLIIVNADGAMIRKEKRGQTALKVHADARDFIRELADAVTASPGFRSGDRQDPVRTWRPELDDRMAQWKGLLESAASPERSPVSPGFVMKILGSILPKNTIVTTGQGVHLVYANDYLSCFEPGTFLSSNNFGAMGFGFPAALAAKLVHPGRQVLAILGDGDFLMTVQDMETMVRERLGIKVLVINDNSYRVLWLSQRIALGGKSYGTEHGNPDMALLAGAFGVPAFRISSASDAADILGRAVTAEGPALIEVVVDREDMAPTNIEAFLKMRGLPPLE